MKLWALAQAAGGEHRFELDLHEEVFESCAYHFWGLRQTDAAAIGTLILGGGVPKNFNLQPEPALSQILGLEDISGFLYDIQITTAPITDGSLSSCPPAEAVTWGKVDQEHFRSTCESLLGRLLDGDALPRPALLEKRARFERWAEKMGREALFAKHPFARGYLRPREGYQLLGKRKQLLAELMKEVKKNAPRLEKESRYPLAGAKSAAAKPARRPATRR